MFLPDLPGIVNLCSSSIHTLTILTFSSAPPAHLGVSSTHLGGHLQGAIRGRSAHSSAAAPPPSLCAFCLGCGGTGAGKHSVSTFTHLQHRRTVEHRRTRLYVQYMAWPAVCYILIALKFLTCEVKLFSRWRT